jgi:radical SAM protein with 4Fe4S-binding SPASM domain
MESGLARMAARAERAHKPLSVMLELTHACPLACTHCYLCDSTESPRSELTTDEVIHLIDEVRAAGCMFLGLSGGEISTRSDLLELVAHGRRLGLAVSLSTTGWGWTPKEIEEVAALSPDVRISLYSADPVVHDRITGTEGSHRAALTALEQFAAHGVHTTVNCVAMRENASGLAQLIALAETLGANLALDPTVTATVTGDPVTAAQRAGRPQLESFFALPAMQRFAHVARQHPAADEPMCGIGKRSCVIGPSGDVYACTNYRKSLGNIRRQSFADIWQRSPHLQWLRNLTAADLTGCNACDRFSYCNRCAVVAQAEDGDFLGPSEWACGIAAAKEASRRQP